MIDDDLLWWRIADPVCLRSTENFLPGEQRQGYTSQRPGVDRLQGWRNQQIGQRPLKPTFE